jgi:hypothetical protein
MDGRKTAKSLGWERVSSSTVARPGQIDVRVRDGGAARVEGAGVFSADSVAVADHGALRPSTGRAKQNKRIKGGKPHRKEGKPASEEAIVRGLDVGVKSADEDGGEPERSPRHL